MENSLEELKKFYKETFNIRGEIVELRADFDILTLFIRGASNKTISEFFKLPIEVVEEILKKYFDGFSGWEEDLSFNPIKMHEESLEETKNESFVRLMNFLCERYLQLDKILNDEWI